MTRHDLAEYDGLRPGDDVILVRESGFDGGKPQRKTLAEIKMIEWTQEEARKINMPRREVFYKFTDGSCAGCFDAVYKAEAAR